MKIIYIFALIGIISSSTFPIPTLYFNYDYVLDKASIAYAEYYFRAVVDQKTTMDFELVVKNKEFTENYFEIRVVGYSLVQMIILFITILGLVLEVLMQDIMIKVNIRLSLINMMHLLILIT